MRLKFEIPPSQLPKSMVYYHKIIELRKLGMSYREIAEKLNVTIRVVEWAIKHQKKK